MRRERGTRRAHARTSTRTRLSRVARHRSSAFCVCRTRRAAGYLGEVMLWFFALVSNVLLVNLLIAMMSETYTTVKENADVRDALPTCAPPGARCA